MSTVINPKDTPDAINRSIRDMPVTISALSMGMLVTPMTRVRIFLFIPIMATDAAVPTIVAIRADIRAIARVFQSAWMIALLSNMFRYHFRVKPPHLALDLDELNERMTRVNIGAYKRINIRAT